MNLYKVKFAVKRLPPFSERLILAPHMEGALGFVRVWLSGTESEVVRIKEVATDVAVVTEA